MSTIDEMLAAAGDEAERTPTPTGGTRPGRGRSVMFSIRLNPDELEALNHYAEQEGLPARTLARAWILQALERRDTIDARVRRLEQAVFRKTA